MKNENVPLRLLVENEVFRLSVWTNPSNDPKRGTDHVGTVEKVMMDVSRVIRVDSCTDNGQSSWISALRTVWKIDPAIAIAMSERFNVATLNSEVTRLVRSNTREILDCPEALRFLIGDRLDASVKRDIKVLARILPPFLNTHFSHSTSCYGHQHLLSWLSHSSRSVTATILCCCNMPTAS